MRLMWTLLGLSGCLTTSGLSDDFEDELTVIGGCADLVAFAYDIDDTMLFEVFVDAPIAAAGGAPTQTVVSLPDPFAVLRVDVGSQVSDATCDDLIVNGGPKVSESWTAIEGVVIVDVRPGLDEDRADVLVEDVVFESPDGEQVTIETFQWTDLMVGWFAG